MLYDSLACVPALAPHPRPRDAPASGDQRAGHPAWLTGRTLREAGGGRKDVQHFPGPTHCGHCPIASL